MYGYIMRRLVFGGLTVLGVSIVVFVVLRILPGDPLVAIFGPEGFTKLSDAERAHLMAEWDHEETRAVDWVLGAAMYVRRRAMRDVGLMDERYFVYVDDVDFMYRAMKAGMRLLYLPEIRLLHKVSSLTGKEESISMIRYCTRNRVFFLLKHLGLIRSLPLLIAYQLHFLL